MKRNTYHLIVGVIFSIIAVLHALRLIYGWTAVIDGWTLPMWLSWAAIIIAGFLAYHAFKFSNQE